MGELTHIKSSGCWEVCIQPRMYNTIITIGVPGSMVLDDQW
jgi:hypothetical protein